MKQAICLDCSTIMLVEDDIHIGLEVTCPECEEVFEVVQLSPVQLDWVYEDEYDYSH